MPVFKLRRQRTVTADQRRRRIRMAFGLKNLVALNFSELANRPIDRTQPRRFFQPTRTGFQGAGEKIVKRGVTGDVWIRRFRHIHAITPDKPANHRSGRAAQGRAGKRASQRRQRLLGDKILR